MSNFKTKITNAWYDKKLHLWQYLLTPFSLLFLFVITLRKLFYKYGLLKTTRSVLPVIVVGNITVGGSGKTPLVIALCELLKKQGYNPGIVSRGYGGSLKKLTWVTPDMNPCLVGDEAIMLARRTDCPVVISRKRTKAIKSLFENSNCNIVISDDGLQHYAMGRDVEIAVVDNVRQFGNGWCLPVGPLREPLSRLQKIDFIIHNGGEHDFGFSLKQHGLINLADKTKSFSVEMFKGKEVHAVAGIGNPDRFFNQLEEQGVRVLKHNFADHHCFKKKDLNFGDDKAIVMTEKDAVKCEAFAKDNMWFLPVSASLTENCKKDLLDKLRSLR